MSGRVPEIRNEAETMTAAQIDQLVFAGSILGAAALLVGIGVWVGGVNEFRKGMTTLLDGIRQDIQDLRQDIKQLLRSTARTTESGSPRRLTEAGESIAAGIEAKRWALSTAASMLEQGIEAREPYELEELAREHIQEKRPLGEPVRRAAYENGIDVEQVDAVLVVCLRDALIDLLGRDHGGR